LSFIGFLVSLVVAPYFSPTDDPRMLEMTYELGDVCSYLSKITNYRIYCYWFLVSIDNQSVFISGRSP